MSVALWVMLCGLAVFCLRILITSLGTLIERHRVKRSVSKDSPLSVSVVVPARNEEHNIESCVRSIFANAYPVADFEVIVVNDRSEDQTSAILQRLQQEFPALRVHHTTEEEIRNNVGLHGKARAVHQGILLSKGELILMTDADCQVAEGWVRGIVEHYGTDQIGMVASFTLINARRPFAMLQAVEWVLSHTLAMAGVGLGKPLGCFGNNISIRRKTYDSFGGYAEIPFSVTEDLALMQAVDRSPWGLRYACGREVAVVTEPAANWGEFFRQHIRWANGGRALGWRAAAFVLSSAGLWLAFVASFFVGPWWTPLAVFCVRLIGDAITVLPSLRVLGRLPLAFALPIAIPFLMLLELVIPFLLLTRNVHWKGQVFRT
jgi:cellulose synthase/poly-beta-1,6-N-acetylglucosamine synthase-like glycosyltransferase